MKKSRDHIFLTVVLLPTVLVFCSCGEKAGCEERFSKQQVQKSNIQVTVVERPDTSKSNSFYCTNRPPLSVNPLVKLPLGSIRPASWLKHQIELMAEGMTSHLTELSRFLADDNGWFGTDKDGWEEQPYWLRGFYPMAVISGDKQCLAKANRWIEAVLTSQDEDGYFGARYNKRIVGKNGRVLSDLWPHMVMLDAVIQYYEHTGDERVIGFMRRFFEFCRDLPDGMFLPRVTQGGFESLEQDFGSWRPGVQLKRAGDMLSHIYWLYNHTGDEWLLKLASRFYEHILPARDEWLDDHVVNFTSRFAYPGIYSQQSGQRWHLAQTEYWYAQHLGTWGQQPGGIFGADERIRPGKTDPRQAFETCAMVEFAKSFYLLSRITGGCLYADRCEDLILNHFPAAQMPDLKALHYLTASNQPQLDAGANHEYRNKGPMLLYSPHIHRCCQHNVSMGWPWYAQNLWQATADNGLAAWLYAASEVTARVGRQGEKVTIRAKTDYPFKDTVQMTVTTGRPVKFPLYLRVPRWCKGFSIAVNGEKLNVDAQPQSYVRIERVWSKGDRLDIEMPMEISLTEWPRTGSVTVNRGPLSYSVRIEERWKQYGSNEKWPEWEVLPDSPWNYGLVIDRNNAAASLEVTVKDVISEQPWTVKDAPVQIKAKAKRIAGWKLENNTVEELQESPIRSDEPIETITMIPLGCARLRMSCLPTIGTGPDAHEWKGKSAASELDVRWWRQGRFGLFIHWGPVSLTGEEIGWSRGGKRRGPGATDHPEGPTPIEVYDNLYKKWNPDKFDAEQWVRIAKDAGMRYLVFTTKHHDGFVNFDSKLTDYKITSPESPFRRDIVDELAEACHKGGLGLGFYYSMPDLHHPDYWMENHARYIEYVHGQLRELCSNYGRVDIIWFDMGSDGKWAERWDSKNLFRMIRRLQPNVIINDRGGLPGDFVTPEQEIGKFQTRPWETCMTLCEQWAWKSNDEMKSLKQCLQSLVRIVGGDGNFLFNVGPMPNGWIEPRQAQRLREVGRWLEKYGQSIYATRGGPFRPADWGVTTYTGKTIYVHILDRQCDPIILGPIQKKIVSNSVLTGGTAVVKQTENSIEISVPQPDHKEIDTIVVLQLDGLASEVKPRLLPWESVAAGKKAAASSIHLGQPWFAAAKAFDDDFETRWATDYGVCQAWLEVDLGESVTFARALLSEAYGERVQRFELQYKDGQQWRTFAGGTNIGLKLELEFAAVTAQHVRLNIIETNNGVGIAEFQLLGPDFLK